MNRLERLLNLVAALLDADRPLSRAEIVSRVPGYEGEPESVRRGFERDKDALRAMGIPISVEPLDPLNPGLGDGYRVHRSQYELADPGLEPDELAALHLAASAVRLEGGTGPEAVWKLGGAPGGGGDRPPVAALPGSEHLTALFAAVSERRTVRFSYRAQARSVDPLRLSFANGWWYLDGHDHLRGEERRFRLDRFESVPTPGEPGAFHRPADPGPGLPQPWRMGDEEEVEAVVLVDADQADWTVAKVGEEAVRERRPDGAVVLALPVRNRDAFLSFVLGFLDHVEVLGPPELRQAVVDWLRDLAGRAS